MPTMQDATGQHDPPPLPGHESLVVVGLGGNIGSVQRSLSGAITALSRCYDLLAVSALYRSAPVGPDQPNFLNAGALLRFDGDLFALLSNLQAMEAAAGRRRAERWGPRTLDLDVLWAGPRRVSESTLTVPHVALRGRLFALLPLLDLVPNAADPTDGMLYSECARVLETQRVELVQRDRWW